MNKDTLKKHHFWILIGLIPLLVLIAVITITSEVGGAIETKRTEITKAKTDLGAKQSPTPNAVLTELEKQRTQLANKQTELWKENWERQIGLASGKQDPAKNLLRWPNSRLFARFNYTEEYLTNKEQLKFGATIPDPEGEYTEFQKPEIYLAEFSNGKTGMADRIAPTTFNGGWERILRHVAANGWGQTKPTSEQLWLALEDIWVQRAMLAQVQAVNDQIGTFRKAPLLDANNQSVETELHRAFESRIWRVELKVVRRQDGRFAIEGKLANITDRLQLFGNGNMMTLNIWFANEQSAQPFPYRIGGESLPGRGARKTIKDGNNKDLDVPADVITVEPSEQHVLPVGISPTEIARVEQVFDTRTVPIRRIDHMALGYRDSRHALAPLLMPKFEVYKKEEAAAAEAASAMPQGSGGPGGMGGPPMGPSPGPTPGGFGGPGPRLPGFPGGPGGPGGTAATSLEGGGTAESVLVANKKRYIAITDHVRRMPVAFTVIVDQDYIQDVLMAYANSPLRFQVTQVHWQRFRGSLGLSISGSGSMGTPEDTPLISGSGREGSGFRFEGEAGPGPSPFGPRRPGFGPGSGSGPPLPMGSSGPGPMGFPGGPGPGYPPGMGMPGGPGGSLSTLTESQLTSGLVELTVYGVVSLYEKFQPAPAEGEVAGK